MKKITLLLCFIVINFAGFAQTKSPNLAVQDIHQTAQLPFKQGHIDSHLSFIENKNQWDNAILFRADVPGGFVFLKDKALQYSLYDAEAMKVPHPVAPQKETNKKNKSKLIANQTGVRAHGVEVNFVNANSFSHPQGQAKNPEIRNYFLGNDPAKWASGVNSFQKIVYKEIYHDIDLQVYENKGNIKYEFALKVGADAKQILLQYEGADGLRLENGNLIIETSLGIITEKKPYCYQMIAGKEVAVPASFVLKGNQVSFSFSNGYDKKLPLIIDPELVFSTYSGSTVDNWGSTATFDDKGNLYSGGIVLEVGNGFPVTTGAFQVQSKGSIDIGILKFSSKGDSLKYATYLGGGSAEFPHSLVVNKNHELIIMGTTSSSNFPITNTSFDNTFNGGQFVDAIPGITYQNGSDIFVSKLSEDGKVLKGSTYLGGSGNDGITNFNLSSFNIAHYGDEFRGEVIVDEDENIYVVSTTYSSNFPVKNAFKSTLSGFQDGVIIKLNPDLSNTIWASYIGGSSIESVFSIKLNAQKQVYVCGATQSADLRAVVPNNPSIPAPLFATYQDQGNNDEDGFIAKLSNDGALIQITYLGTPQADQTYLLDLDPAGNVHVLGLTLGNYPVTVGTFNQANSRQFIHKLDPDLSQTIFSTIIGSGRGAPDINPTAFMINDCGNIYLAGWGSSLGGRTQLSTNNLTVTADAFAKTTDGNDFYIMILEKDAKSLLYATFFGGNLTQDHVDGGTSRFDKSGVIYHAACASCGGVDNDFPTTAGVWSKTNRSNNCNNAAFKFDIGRIIADLDLIDIQLQTIITRSCTYPINVNIKYNGSGATKWTWQIDGNQVNTQKEFNHVFDHDAIYTITLTAENPISCLKSVKVEKKLPVTILSAQASPNMVICPGDSTVLGVNSNKTNVSYSWTPSRGLSNTKIANPIAKPTETTTYRVLVTDEYGCRAESSVEVKVVPKIELDFEVATSNECNKPSEIAFKNNTKGATNYQWTISNGEVFKVENPEPYIFSSPGTYTVTLAAYNETCQNTKSVEVTVENNSIPPPNVITPNADPNNEYWVLSPERKGYKVELFNRWGKLIYKSDNYQDNWGKGADSGIYYYTITSPQGVVCKGWLHVVK